MKKSVSTVFIIILVAVVAVIGGFSAIVLQDRWAAADSAPDSDQSLIQQNTEPSPSGEFSAVEIGELLSKSVVGVSNLAAYDSAAGEEKTVEMSTGSGVIIDPRGYIVTNYHVISSSEDISVTLSDGSQAQGIIVGKDKRTDLALLKIEGENFNAATLGDSDSVKVGETAIAIGNPGGLDFASSLTQGVISGLNRPLTTEEGLRFKLIQTDAAINPGNSGGALVNSQGQVIGINTIKISEEGFEGMGFAIPANLVKDIIEELMENGTVTRAAMGVYLLGSIGSEYMAPNDAIDRGVVISVRQGGPGAQGGLLDNDVITAVDGNEIADIYELQEVIFQHKVGDTVEVKVYRQGGEVTCKVVLGELEEE